MSLRQFLFSLFLLFISGLHSINAQGYVRGEFELRGLFAEEGDLPFWMYHNQRGRLSENSTFGGYFGGIAGYEMGKFRITTGAGAFFDDGQKEDLQLDELFVSADYSWLEVTLGMEQREELYRGLSTSNESILWSLNSRPLPGLKLKTNRPVFVDREHSLGFEVAWEEYLLGEDRYVQDAHLHHKGISLIWRFHRNWQLQTGIRHFAMWGGESPAAGTLSEGFEDYLRMVTGRGGDENALETDQLNVLGSHLGSYEFTLRREINGGSLTFLFNSIFEDGSGSRGANFPDGRYGLYFSAKDEKNWINGLIYEFYYTKDQSQTLPHLYDNYFNNGVYASGWTHNGRVLGLPFMMINYYEDYPPGPSVVRVGNNNLLAHHIGISGMLRELPYKLLLSYRRNYGHYRNITGVGEYIYYPPDDPRGRYNIPAEVISAYGKFAVLRTFVHVDLELGADLSNEGNNFGGGVLVRYQVIK